MRLGSFWLRPWCCFPSVLLLLEDPRLRQTSRYQEKVAFAEEIKMAGETVCDLDKKTSLTSDAEMRPEPPAPCINPGNPVFSCMLDPKTLHTSTSLSKPQMIMYKTNASQYGAFSPRPCFLPCKYLPQEQMFTEHLRATGFYQNNSLNVGPDRTRTVDSPNYQHTL